MAEVLDDTTIDGWLTGHPAWRRESNELRCDVECASFRAAIDLVGVIADLAEQRDHHPDIDIRWRTVHLTLSTHSAGGITEKDLDLAAAIDAAAS